jgi:hypothetical protein
MGLKEKQAMATLDFSWSEKRIQEYTGVATKVELDTNSFSNDIDAIWSADQRGAVAIANGIASVCYNDIGKDAFNEKKVNKVVLRNQEAGKRSIEFEGNTLTMAFAFTNSSDAFSESEIRETIENML